MKILLINAQSGIKNRYTKKSTMLLRYFPPLVLISLQQLPKKHIIDIIDEQRRRVSHLKKYDLVGITYTTPNTDRGLII